jgi:hypothetical protein
MRSLNATGQRVASFAALVAALRSSVDSRRAIVAFFHAPSCTLLDQPMTAFVDLAAVDRLVEQSGTFLDCGLHLRRLQQRGERFKLFADLVAAMKEAQVLEDRRRSVQLYLFGSACTLLKDPAKARKQAELNTADLDLLIELSNNSPEEAVRTLQSMEGFDMRFGTHTPILLHP